MNHTKNVVFMLLIAFTASSIVIAIPVARAAEPTLESILDTAGFPLSTLVLTETFPAGVYRTTMYAEYAGYAYDNQLRWYPVTMSTFNLIFDGPDGVPQNTMGMVTPPLTKYFTASANFGLSLLSPDGTWYTETTRNIDGQKHAKIYQSQTDSNLYLIGFENMGAGSGSDFDYNDMVLSLERVQYYLTVNNGGHGTASGQNWYDAGTPATFGISPTTVSGGTGVQYVFTGWSSSDPGGYTGSLPSTAVTMNNNITETAHWKTQYYLTVKTDPSGIVTIPGQDWYDSASPVTLTAPAGPMSNPFLYWDVDGASQGSLVNPITVTMSTAHTATAHYYVPSVGGEWAPINTVQLVTPWIAYALLAIASAVALSHHLLKKRW